METGRGEKASHLVPSDGVWPPWDPANGRTVTKGSSPQIPGPFGERTTAL